MFSSSELSQLPMNDDDGSDIVNSTYIWIGTHRINLAGTDYTRDNIISKNYNSGIECSVLKVQSSILREIRLRIQVIREHSTKDPDTITMCVRMGKLLCSKYVDVLKEYQNTYHNSFYGVRNIVENNEIAHEILKYGIVPTYQSIVRPNSLCWKCQIFYYWENHTKFPSVWLDEMAKYVTNICLNSITVTDICFNSITIQKLPKYRWFTNVTTLEVSTLLQLYTLRQDGFKFPNLNLIVLNECTTRVEILKSYKMNNIITIPEEVIKIFSPVKQMMAIELLYLHCNLSARTRKIMIGYFDKGNAKHNRLCEQAIAGLCVAFPNRFMCSYMCDTEMARIFRADVIKRRTEKAEFWMSMAGLGIEMGSPTTTTSTTTSTTSTTTNNVETNHHKRKSRVEVDEESKKKKLDQSQ